MASAQPISQPPHRGAPPMNNPQQAVSPPSKEQLKSWWPKFRKRGKTEDQAPVNPGIFGVPLSESILYANVAISLTNEEGESFIYGYVPIVIAKCGVFLKEKATDVEGIFRLSGSAKRIKDLQTVFNSPERYGKGLDWNGYTVHDAANILRRYLNQLPEPIVPLRHYEQFRDPLRAYQAKVGSTTQAQAMENQEHSRAVVAYQKLITELPALNRQLLLYILDLLAVFASKSDMNRMTAQNLAAIFQPGIISHPSHDMAPNEYRLSQDVLIFLIENQDNFLIGMSGTAMDEKTKDEVKSGPPSIKTPKAIGRSASTASTGAERTGAPRRNGSISSRNSRERSSPGVSGAATPASTSGTAGTTGGGGGGGGIGRSNTLPSTRSPVFAGSRFHRMSEVPPLVTPTNSTMLSSGGPGSDQREEDEEAVPFPPITGGTGRPSTPPLIGGGPGHPASPIQEQPEQIFNSESTIPVRSIDASIPIREPANEGNADSDPTVPPYAYETRPPLDTASAVPASGKSNGRDRKISSLLSISPIFGPSDQSRDANQRQPRKLQKRRIPGSHNESAQSSQASLNVDEGGHLSSEAVSVPTAEQPHANFNATSLATQDKGSNRNLMPPRSPTPSIHSRGSATDPSDLDALEDSGAREESRRHRFRLSSTKQEPPLLPPPPIGQLPGARTSNSSLGSNRPRKSLTGDSQLTQTSIGDSSSTGQPSFVHVSSRESADMFKDYQAEPEKKGLFGRFKAKITQTRDHYEAERAKSPPRIQGDHAGSRSSLSAFTHEHLAARGRSFDRSRQESLSSVQERDTTQRADVQAAPMYQPGQTYVQHPTPALGPTPVSEASHPMAPAFPSLPQQPIHSNTFPVVGPSMAPPVPTAFVPPPTAESNLVTQNVISNEPVEIGPSSPVQKSHEIVRSPVLAPSEQGGPQEILPQSMPVVTEGVKPPHEQANESASSTGAAKESSPVTIEQSAQATPPSALMQPAQSVPQA